MAVKLVTILFSYSAAGGGRKGKADKIFGEFTPQKFVLLDGNGKCCSVNWIAGKQRPKLLVSTQYNMLRWQYFVKIFTNYLNINDRLKRQQ